MIIKRDDRILEARYLSREGDTGTRWWSAMRGRNKLSVFNGSVVSSEVTLAGRPGQMVFLSDAGGDVFVSPPGVGLTPTALIVTFSGFAVQHSFINRVFPPPPPVSPGSILIAGAEPASLSWTISGLAGGTITHGTQTNSITFYADYNGAGAPAVVVCSWICTLVRLSSGIYSIAIGGLPFIGASSWGRTASCGIGQTVVNSNPTPQLSTLPFGESFANGGAFNITPVY